MSLSDSMTAKLSGLTDRYDEVAALLHDAVTDPHFFTTDP